jgi:hypothetical protein
MSCHDTWKGAKGDIPLHEMTEEHLRNAQRHTKELLGLYRLAAKDAYADIAESENRSAQLQREVERREREKCLRATQGIGASGTLGPAPSKVFPSVVDDLEKRLGIAEARLVVAQNNLADAVKWACLVGIRESKTKKSYSALRNEIYRLDQEQRIQGFLVRSLQRLIQFMEEQ